MPELVAIESRGGSVLGITWQTSNICNHRCDYCNPGNWQGDRRNDAADTYLRNLQQLMLVLGADKHAKIKVFFSGGEPTHWQPLLQVCQALDSAWPGKITFAINTNLSRPLDWWQANHHWFDDVVASYHPGWAKHEQWMANASYLQDKVNYLAVRMMMHEQHWDHMLAVADDVWSALDNVTLEYVPIMDEMSVSGNPYAYDDQDKMSFFASQDTKHKRLRSVPPNRVGDQHVVEVYDDGSTLPVNSNRLTAKRQNFFRGWSCDIGTSINIGINGDITLGSCGVMGVIGNIADHALAVDGLKASITCPKLYCHCGTDMSITKRRPHVI